MKEADANTILCRVVDAVLGGICQEFVQDQSERHGHIIGQNAVCRGAHYSHFRPQGLLHCLDYRAQKFLGGEAARIGRTVKDALRSGHTAAWLNLPSRGYRST